MVKINICYDENCGGGEEYMYEKEYSINVNNGDTFCHEIWVLKYKHVDYDFVFTAPCYDFESIWFLYKRPTNLSFYKIKISQND